jgi:hypothetical protein
MHYPYYDCRWPFRQRLGESTSATFRAPERVTAEEVVQFYISEMGPDWEASREDVGVVDLATGPQGSIPMARFVRDTAIVHVGTEQMVTPPGLDMPGEPYGREFTVSVDAEGTVERPYCD